MVEPERPQLTIWLLFARWISKATRAQAQARALHTHTHKYVIIIAFPLQQWFRERVSLLRYTYITSRFPLFLCPYHLLSVYASFCEVLFLLFLIFFLINL